MSAQILSGGAQQRFDLSDASRVGECRRAVQTLAMAHQFDETCAGRAAIVATELANNVVRHAGAGELLIQVWGQDSAAEIEILAIDRGPGMTDVQQCMRDGYSTGGSAGTGLGAVARLSRTFDVYSVPDAGTVVLSRLGRSDPSRAAPARSWAGQFDYGAICLPLQGEFECGDSWVIAERGAEMTLLVVDGLGHGPFAAAAARLATEAFGANSEESPAESMTRLHRALNGSRGAAAASCSLPVADAQVQYAGVGNICGSLVAAQSTRGMVSHNGTLGVKLLRIQQFAYDWAPGASIVMHSDGLSHRWSAAPHGDLVRRHPAIIAAVLYRDFRRERDDATVVVVNRRQ